MPEKDQQFIYSKAELSLIKNTFAGDDTLLYTIRKVLLQFPLTEVERGLIKTTITPEVLAVLKKRLLPDLAPEYPLGQLSSILTNLTQDLKVKDVEQMAAQFAAKQTEIDYLAQQFDELQGIESPAPILLSELGTLKGKDPHSQFVDMTAYLFLLGYIDPSLNMIKLIAGAKDETPEEQAARLSRDSSQ